jgi:hypothetical protein
MNNSPADHRSPLGLFPGQPTPSLHDRLVEVLRTRHYSRRTGQACVRGGRFGTCMSSAMRRRRGVMGKAPLRNGIGCKQPFHTFATELP